MNKLTQLTFSSLIILSLVGCAAQPYYGQSVYEQSDTRPVYSSNRYTPPPEPAYQPSPYQSEPYQEPAYQQAPYQENRYQNDRSIAARYGVVQEVRRTNVQEAKGLGGGAIIGALIGGVVGNQFGHGSGRALATVGGVVAGGAVGQGIQNNNEKNQEGYLITVHLDNGNLLTIAQDTHDWIRVGQRVRIDGQGDNLRVVPE